MAPVVYERRRSETSTLYLVVRRTWARCIAQWRAGACNRVTKVREERALHDPDGAFPETFVLLPDSAPEAPALRPKTAPSTARSMRIYLPESMARALRLFARQMECPGQTAFRECYS